MAGSTMNVYHMAIKFLFEDVLERRMWINIKYSVTNKITLAKIIIVKFENIKLICPLFEIDRVGLIVILVWFPIKNH